MMSKKNSRCPHGICGQVGEVLNCVIKHTVENVPNVRKKCSKDILQDSAK